MKTTDVGELYILLDGTHAASGDCAKGGDGKLCGPSGVPVAMTDEGDPMTVKRQAELGGNAMAAEAGKANDGEPLATTENQAVATRAANEKPAEEPRPHGRMVQGMMPVPAEKPESKGKEPKGE